MNDRRAKIVAGATAVGLAALGGVALGTNPGPPTAMQVAGTSGATSVVTGASGAATVPVAETAARHQRRPPIVTRASGGGAGINFAEED